MTIPTIQEALRRASFLLKSAGIESARTEAELLLAYCLGNKRLHFFLHGNSRLSDETFRAYERIVNRRCNNEPLAYITGEKYFYGRPFFVDRRVLIPRPETELLVDRAKSLCAEFYQAGKVGCRVLDLGTGSGILAVSLALELSDCQVYAVDISEEALAVARHNAKLFNVEQHVIFLQGCYFEALKNTEHFRFQLILSNPPYISASELEDLPHSVSGFEPKQALYGGTDGLDAYRYIIKGVGSRIARPGALLLEIGAGQQKAVEEMLKRAKIFNSIHCEFDLAGHPRVIVAQVA